jgi:hypothetical protein
MGSHPAQGLSDAEPCQRRGDEGGHQAV